MMESFIVTDGGMVMHRENHEAMARRLPGHWALQNPRPFGEPEPRGGLSRCRFLAQALSAALVIA
jgi:hypothetical protein